MRTTPFIATVAAVALASSGFAAGIQKHEKRAEKRIEGGEDSGRLTPKEAERLENQQKVIEEQRQDALEDGEMGKRERRDIRHDQKRLSRDIHNKKHNERKARPD
jgi:hypothetical protein